MISVGKKDRCRSDTKYVNFIISMIGLLVLIDTSKSVFPQYLLERAEMLRSQTSIDSYLELLNYDRYEAILEIRDPSLLELSRYQNLFHGLGIEMDKLGLMEENYVFAIGQNGSDILTDFYYDGNTEKSVIGELTVSVDETEYNESNTEGTYRIYLDHEECYTVLPEDNYGTKEDPFSRTDIRIWVRDGKSGDVIDIAAFSYDMVDGVVTTMKAEHKDL